ncbi:MAG: Cof-type HAD-IIB family hydrolase [Bacilli bacterium]|nr:Cof-type HAD-IIB family hydrolase [Bacilli bacterium]
MNKPHLIAIDVDGTLLTREGRLSKRTKDVLLSCQRQGDAILLSSGRPWRSLRGFYEQLGLTGPVVCYNGALVFDPCDPSFKRLEKRLDREAVVSIYEAFAPSLMGFMCESETSIYIDHPNDYLGRFFPYEGMKIEKGPLSRTLKDNPFTAIFEVKERDGERLREAIEKRAPLRFRRWHGVPYGEAYLSGVDKGSALLYVMTELGFGKESVVAFGDSDNDYEMLLLAGRPFVMEGCHSPLLLREFPHTKKGNDQDGLALALEDLLDA